MAASKDTPSTLTRAKSELLVLKKTLLGTCYSEIDEFECKPKLQTGAHVIGRMIHITKINPGLQLCLK